MKTKTQYFFAIIWILFFACTTRKDVAFDNNDLKWLRPFNTTDTIIYRSQNGLSDTITFFQQESNRSSVSSFEQGSYTTYSKSVTYKLTDSSYHKFIQVNSNGIQVYSNSKKQYLFSLSKSNNQTETGMEISFLGLIFNESYLKSLRTDSIKVLTLDEVKAAYKNMNVTEGIKTFDFDFQKGIISFIDYNNVKWKRNR